VHGLFDLLDVAAEITGTPFSMKFELTGGFSHDKFAVRRLSAKHDAADRELQRREKCRTSSAINPIRPTARMPASSAIRIQPATSDTSSRARRATEVVESSHEHKREQPRRRQCCRGLSAT